MSKKALIAIMGIVSVVIVSVFVTRPDLFKGEIPGSEPIAEKTLHVAYEEIRLSDLKEVAIDIPFVSTSGVDRFVEFRVYPVTAPDSHTDNDAYRTNEIDADNRLLSNYSYAQIYIRRDDMSLPSRYKFEVIDKTTGERAESTIFFDVPEGKRGLDVATSRVKYTGEFILVNNDTKNYAATDWKSLHPDIVLPQDYVALPENSAQEYEVQINTNLEHGLEHYIDDDGVLKSRAYNPN